MSELFTLPNVAAGVIGVALNGYVVLGGADFGGGVWDFFATGTRAERQRRLIAHAIGPIWEANHVWLIIVVVLLFTCFPPAFAALAIALHIPLSLMLVGIVLRGSAFIFRSYDSRDTAVQRRWGTIFAIASVVTPLLLGICVGTIASGSIPLAGDGLASGGTPGADAPGGSRGFMRTFVAPWNGPFPVAVGVLTLALFAFLAAVYLTVEAEHDAELQEDFRWRALACAGAVFVAAFGTLLVAYFTVRRMGERLMWSPFAMPLHLLTGVAAVMAIGALLGRRYRLARVAAAAQVSLILWGWVMAQYPYLIPPHLTIADAAAPQITLRLTLWTLAPGALLLFPSLAYLFRIFKGAGSAFDRVEEGE